MLKILVVTAALAAATLAHAQTMAPASAPKGEQLAKVLQLLQPAIEAMASQLALQPALQIQQGAAAALQRVPAERREALARDIEADLRKYAEETVPAARARADKIGPSTIGPLLSERFTEDELRQLAAQLDSPLNRKFQMAFPDMQRALGQKLVADAGPEIEAKARALDQTVGKRLGLKAPAAAASGAKASASAPAKK